MRVGGTNPTDPFITFEHQNPPQNLRELLKIPRSPDLYLRSKIVEGPVGLA